MSAPDKHPTRVQVEVNGFTWRVYGARTGLRWHCHLVELVGPLPVSYTHLTLPTILRV